MNGRLDGKVAVITGGGQGIGEATAVVMAEQGAVVVIAEQNAQTGAAVATNLMERGYLVEARQADVTDSVAMEKVAAEVIARHGRIDVLVANAGINVFHEPLETSVEEWRRCFSVDLDGVWNSARAVLPQMRIQSSGSIVAIASTHSFSIIPNCFPYPVAKHGLIGLVRALGIQYAREGIRVNAIAPGYVETQICRDYWATFPDPEAERQRAYELHPPGRIGRPEEVANTALFLATDEAPFINASTIVIDGGRSVVYHD